MLGTHFTFLGNAKVKVEVAKITIYGGGYIHSTAQSNEIVNVVVKTFSHPTDAEWKSCCHNPYDHLVEHHSCTLRDKKPASVKFQLKRPVTAVHASGSTEVTIVDPNSAFYSDKPPVITMSENGIVKIVADQKEGCEQCLDDLDETIHMRELMVVSTDRGCLIAPDLTVDKLKVDAINFSMIYGGIALESMMVSAADCSIVFWNRKGSSTLTEDVKGRGQIFSYDNSGTKKRMRMRRESLEATRKPVVPETPAEK